jgi:hypothetical protein
MNLPELTVPQTTVDLRQSALRHLARAGWRVTNRKLLYNKIWKYRQGKGSAYHRWWDHVIQLHNPDTMQDGVLCQPYDDLNSAELESVIDVAKALDLEVQIGPNYSTWYPGHTQGVFFWERAT